MILVQLPYHLRTLAGLSGDVQIQPDDVLTVEDVIDVIEKHYPMLAGTIREHGTLKRRAYVRFFAAGRDISHEPMSMQLPDSVRSGQKPFIILGAISGG